MKDQNNVLDGVKHKMVQVLIHGGSIFEARWQIDYQSFRRSTVLESMSILLILND